MNPASGSERGSGDSTDPIATFYDAHPYPPPIEDVAAAVAPWEDGRRRRFEHSRTWPTLPYRDDPSILVAGCGTSQAVLHAARYPEARVVGIDVSEASLQAAQQLADDAGITNVELWQLPIESVGVSDEQFDRIVCTGVLHHLADPAAGLKALRGVLAPAGALELMVYGRYGRAGIEMMQQYCALLGVSPSSEDIDDLVAVLGELPRGHPLVPTIRASPDFAENDAIADVLLNPRDRSYTVPEFFELIESAEMRFSRWVRQAPYLATCGSITETPHAARLSARSPIEQFIALELFRGTMLRHSAVLHREDSPLPVNPLTWDDESWRRHVPIRATTAISVTERLPPGASAALINQAHVDRDLVLFVDARDLGVFEQIDGETPFRQTVGATASFAKLLWQHDLIAIDASKRPAT